MIAEGKHVYLFSGRVEDKTKEIYEHYKDSGIDTVFELNPGNHFKDADIRLGKGIAWIL